MVAFTREDIPIRSLASGAELRIPVYRITGESDRPKVYIQANIHGPEIAGIGAIYDVIEHLHEEPTIHGSLTIVPSVNPVGLNTKTNGLQTGYADPNETVVGNFNRIYKMLVRDVPSTDPDDPQKVVLSAFVQAHMGSDLDTMKRAFRQELAAALDSLAAQYQPHGPSHGQKLALIIQRMSYDADYLIDLHTAGDAIHHMYTFPECLHSVPYFDLHYTPLLDDSFSGVLDEAFLQPWMRLRKAFSDAGRDIPFRAFELEAFTPELGSADTLSRGAMAEDAERVLNYLRYKGVLSGQPTAPQGTFYYCEGKHYRRYRATTGGLLLWHKAPGESVQAGDTLAVILRPYALNPDGTRSESVEVPIVAREDGVLINRTETQVVHEGLGVCSVMTHLRTID